MIALPRSLARQFRAVLRRCATHADHARDPFVVLRAGRSGLALEAVLTETALRVEGSGRQQEGVLAFPASVLARIEGPSEESVQLEEVKPGQGRATWTEGGSAGSLEFALVSPDAHLSFPALPSRWSEPGKGFLPALSEASQTAAKQMGGRAVHRVLLRGSKGQLIATDGRQLLIQEGFRFPWKEDLLLPRIDAWGGSELPESATVSVGRNDKHVFVRVGSWTFALTVDPDARFPPCDSVIPAMKDITTRIKLTPSDVARLKKELPRLPGAKERPAAITLDAGERVVVRAKGEDKDAAVKILLLEAQTVGPPVRVLMDRKLLLRLLKLGFQEIEVANPDRPLCCRQPSKTFVWMPLGEPAPTAAPREAPRQTTVTPQPEKKEPAMPDTNGKHAGNGDSNSTFDPLAEAETVKALLSEAHSRLSRLIAALKLHRRHARAVKAAVESLRELPPLSP